MYSFIFPSRIRPQQYISVLIIFSSLTSSSQEHWSAGVTEGNTISIGKLEHAGLADATTVYATRSSALGTPASRRPSPAARFPPPVSGLQNTDHGRERDQGGSEYVHEKRRIRGHGLFQQHIEQHRSQFQDGVEAGRVVRIVTRSDVRVFYVILLASS